MRCPYPKPVSFALLALISMFSASASEADALAIPRNIQAVHFPYSTILDPMFDSGSCTTGGIGVPVLYAGAARICRSRPGQRGLGLSLRGIGETDVVVEVDGQPSNSVRINVQLNPASLIPYENAKIAPLTPYREGEPGSCVVARGSR